MNSLLRLVILAAACTVISCAAPIGNLGEGSGGNEEDLDSLTAMPKKTTYFIPDEFVREFDLTVFASHRGGTLYKVPIDEVAITVFENDLFDPNDKQTVLPNEPYPFKSKGLKKVLVEYNNMSDEYYIDVQDPTGMGGGGGSSGDPPIGIEWDY